MKIPKILAAMAIATLVNSGGIVAHAAGTFTPDATANQQTTIEKGDKNDDLSQNKLTSSGEITINGEFNKTINNLPDITEEGRYLRVTMPIKMDFTYDVDTDEMISSDYKIINKSVHAQLQSGKQDLDITEQKIKMNFVGLDDKDSTTVGKNNVEFVDSVNKADKSKLQIPFKVDIKNSRGEVTNTYSLKDIKDKNTAPIEIPANATIQLKLGKITGQELGNKELIEQNQTMTKHGLTLSFEYDGK